MSGAQQVKKAVVLLSGGLDSSTTLAVALKNGFEAHALTALYGQRHDDEIEAAERVAKALGAASWRTVTVDLGGFGGSALTGDIPVPKDGAADASIPVTYVPARNTVLLSLALAYAESIGAHDIFCGVSSVDYSGYPDCRPEFIAAFQSLARLATKAGVGGAEITIHAPLLRLSKAETIQLGLDLGVDFAWTHTCYDPENGRACGACDACRIRRRAFDELGLTDPAYL